MVEANHEPMNLTNLLCLKPLHSSDHGHQQMDENPFSHLALEIEMDRPSANPFDKGVMPSFDDRAIDADYQNETAKKFGDGFGRTRGGNRQPHPKRPLTKETVATPLSLAGVVPTLRQDVTATATSVLGPVHQSTVVKKIPDVHDELDLDDSLTKPSVIIPSFDLKPQINIRSRNVIVTDIDTKLRFTAVNRKPVAEPVALSKPVVHLAPTNRVVHPAPTKPVHYPAPVKPVHHSVPAKPVIHPVSVPAKPVIDYFGTHSSIEAKQEVDQKEEYFRESQLEANKVLFGTEEPSRPLTNVEVSKRKKLILKLVDQKLKKKLTELMVQLGERSNADIHSPSVKDEHADNFAAQMENLVPDSVPDNPNPEHTQNWSTYPSESGDPGWNNLQPEMVHNQETWPIRPPHTYQSNPGWVPQMNPFPPGVDPMHNVRFPGMPPMRPHWNPNPWHPHMRLPDPQWQSQHNWNMPVRPTNPHLMQPNVNLLYPPDVPAATQLVKPAAEIELELKEKEFLERTLMGSKNNSHKRDAESSRRRTPERPRRRSPRRSRPFPRDRKRDDRKRSSEDRLRIDKLKYDNRSATEIVLRGPSSSRLSPLIASPHGSFRHRSLSGDNFQELLYGQDQFDVPASELMAPFLSRSSRSRSRDSRSEDLRVRLSRNKYRSRSPTDLRNKLSDSRQNRDDDLRNQLAERSRRKRSRSRSRGRSSRKLAKADSDDAEWKKFNNIVGMLMNIDRDAELSSREMSEKKEIMRLLLENPDLLELDDKFVYRFGKGRLNLAVKEAENILFPNGVPDERIASLISKKIEGLSTEKKTTTVAKDTVPIEWIKLGNIIDQFLRLTIAERKNLSANDKRMIERDELMLKISDDPNSLSSLASKYGHRNVEWASKFAKKILYHNGVRDKRVDETIAKERSKALERIASKRKSRNSAESHKSRNSCESDAKSSSSEWNQLSAHVTKLVQSALENFEKMSADDVRRRDDLLVQMSRDPDAIRSDTKFTDNIDKAIVNDVISKCKEIIANVKLNVDKAVVIEFERQRTNLINILNSRTRRTCIHDQILSRISAIFGKKNEKLTTEQKKECEILTEELIKDPESLKTNTAALERIGADKLAVDEIIADVKQMLSQLSKARCPKQFHISSSKVMDIPFVVKIVDASDQLNDTTKTVLLKALRDMISEIDNPPKPKLLQQRYIDKRVEVVCANLLTFEWLKRAIVSDFKDKWSGADLKIERVPVETKIPRDKLKSVVAVFKDFRATLPFDDIVKEIRKENSKLYPERWELQDARGKNGDYKKKTIGIDIESLAALEQMNRFARLGRSLVYFDISYMGDNVPNFEATCQ